jgi:hypothetical protein
MDNTGSMARERRNESLKTIISSAYFSMTQLLGKKGVTILGRLYTVRGWSAAIDMKGNHNGKIDRF